MKEIVKEYYKMFLDETKDYLENSFDVFALEQTQKGEVLSATINNAMSKALETIKLEKDIEIISKDLEIKEQELIVHKIKNGFARIIKRPKDFFTYANYEEIPPFTSINHRRCIYVSSTDRYYYYYSGEIIECYDFTGVDVISELVEYIVFEKESIYEKERKLADKQIEDAQSQIDVRNAQSAKDLEVKTKQISTEDKRVLDLDSAINVRNAQSAKDLELKDKQIENAQSQITVREDTNAKDLELKTKQIESAAEQINKIKQDVSYNKTQESLLKQQTIHNIFIKNAEQIADYVMGLSGGGLTPPVGMHTNFFIAIKALLYQAGCDISPAGEVTMIDTNDNTKTLSLGSFIDVETTE